MWKQLKTLSKNCVIFEKRISTGSGLRKSFKHKPIPPKFKEHTREELFGDPKPGWSNVPSGGYTLMVIPLSTFMLGVWQVYRWRWKLGLISEMEEKVHALPIEFPVGDLESLDKMEYRKVKLRGRFDCNNELVMGPRQLFNYGENPSASTSFWGKGQNPTGYHIITPFHVEGQNMAILVNRGWIGDRIPEKHRFIDDTVEIVGVVRKQENRQPFMPKDTGRTGIYLIRDVARMAEQLRTTDAFLDLVSVTGFDLSTARLHNLPVPGQTRVTLRNDHVNYFCTWFSLSAITSYMWYRRFVLKMPLK